MKNNNMKKIAFAFFAVAVLAACNPKTAEVVEEKSTSEFPSPEIAEGSTLFAANCGKCHALPEISKYSQEKWKGIIPPMAKKAKLDATAENNIMKYVFWKLEQK
jgi:mono/diheme cytochrome c family protein